MEPRREEAIKNLQLFIDNFGIPEDIALKPVFYYGYFQGFKVLIDGEKFPKEFGTFYTTPIWEDALLRALKEDKKISVKLAKKRPFKHLEE